MTTETLSALEHKAVIEAATICQLVTFFVDDEVFAVRREENEFVLVADSRGYLLRFRLDQVPTMAGPARGVIFMKIPEHVEVVDMTLVRKGDRVRLYSGDEKMDVIEVDKIQLSGRGARGKKICSGIIKLQRHEQEEG